MSISLLRNVASGLISVFLKSTIKVISSRFTLGFHGSILQHILIPYLGLILTLTPQLIMCSVASMRWWPHNFAGSIISDDQNRCKSVSPWLPDNGGGCVSDWNSDPHLLSTMLTHPSPGVINTRTIINYVSLIELSGEKMLRI